MDTFDQLQLFDKLRKILPKGALEWSCAETIKFLQFANLSVYEAAFAKKQVDGKKMIKSYSTYNYEKFKDKTDVASLLHYQKFIIWAHILKENYDKFLITFNFRLSTFDASKLSPRMTDKRNSLKQSNSITLSPSDPQKSANVASNQNTSSTLSSSNRKSNQKGTSFDFVEDNSNVVNKDHASGQNFVSQSASSQQQGNHQQQQSTQSNQEQFVMTLQPRSSNNEGSNPQTIVYQQRQSQAVSSNVSSNNSSQNIGQYFQSGSNEIYKKLTESFVSFDTQMKLMEMIEESKGNKKGLQNKTRNASRCIKTTERQKKKMIELTEKVSSEKCFLMWNSRMVCQLLQSVQFTSLLHLTELWGLDGFIIQLIIPLYNLRQVELAFECKGDDVEKLFWLSDIFNAIKYTEQYSILNPSSLRLNMNEDPFSSSSLSNSGGFQNESMKNKETVLHHQIQNLMNTNNYNLNSSFTLCVPVKRLSIDTIDSSDQSAASQNLDKGACLENGQKREKWQHNSSNLSQKQEQTFMISNQSKPQGNRKGSEEFTVATMANMQTTQKIENTNQNNQVAGGIEVKVEEIITENTNNINPEFAESIFIPDNLMQNNNVEKKKRISINFNKQDNRHRQSATIKDLEATLQEDNSNTKVQSTLQSAGVQFAESTILNQNEPETFNLGLDNNRCQSQSIQYFIPPNQAKNSILHPIEERDKSAESQSLADSMMTSNNLSAIPSVITNDTRFLDSGVFKSIHMQQKQLNSTVDDFGTSTLVENVKKPLNQIQFQESVILTGQAPQQGQSNTNNWNNKNQKIFENYESCETPKNLQNAFADSVLLDSASTFQTNSLSKKQNEQTPQIPTFLPSLQSQQTASVSRQSFQESTLLTPSDSYTSSAKQSGTNNNNNQNQFCDSVILVPNQPQFQESIIFTPNTQPPTNQPVNKTNQYFPGNAAVRNRASLIAQNNNNANQFQESLLIEQPLPKYNYQKTNSSELQSSVIINPIKPREQQFEESVIINPQQPYRQTQEQQFAESTVFNNNPSQTTNQFQESTLINPVQQPRGVSQYQESTLINPSNNYISRQIRGVSEFQESTLITPIQGFQQNRNTQAANEFQESTLINPISQGNNNNQQYRTTRGVSEFQESTLINPLQNINNNNQNNYNNNNNQYIKTTRGVSEFQESTLITPIQNNLQQNSQFQESTIINPVTSNKSPSKQGFQFQESTIISPNQTNQGQQNTQFQESCIINPQSKTGSSRQSIAAVRNFRQSVVMNVHGEIDFNQSVIFNNQMIYNQKSSSKNNSIVEPQPSQQTLSAQPTSTAPSVPDSLPSEKLQETVAVSKIQPIQTQIQVQQVQQEQRQTAQIYNKRPKSTKSKEYQLFIKTLVQKTPSLSFNPFDMMPIKKQNSIKIRIKSPDGSLFIDQVITTDGATFGRRPDNSIHFPRDNMISSLHAEIFFDNFSFYLRDKGSKQGTFIKMQEINLKKNMVIQLSVYYEIKIVDFDEQSGFIIIGIKKNQVMKNHEFIMKENQQIKFGRDKEKCDIEIKEQSISSVHAKIVYQNKKFKMQDEGSLNGIWLRMSQKGEVSEPFLITPDLSFRIYLINVYVLKLSQPKPVSLEPGNNIASSN